MPGNVQQRIRDIERRWQATFLEIVRRRLRAGHHPDRIARDLRLGCRRTLQRYLVAAGYRLAPLELRQRQIWILEKAA